MVQDHLIELSVGETIQIGQYLVTLLDVEGDELCIEIGGDDQGDGLLVNQYDETLLETV